MQEERQTPSLGLVMRLRIQLWQRVAIFGFRRHNALPAEIRHLGDLVCEHLLHRFGLQDLGARLGVCAIIEEGCDDLAVFGGLSKAAGASGVESVLALFVGEGEKGAAVEVAVWVDNQLAVYTRDMSV